LHLHGSEGAPQTLPVDTLLKSLKLSAQEIDDVVAFLQTLTEKRAGAATRRAAQASSCR
jgi:hypothetical protein